MSDPTPAPEPVTPQERLRRIEEETDLLAQHIDQARGAVHRAMLADSMAQPGEADSWRGVVGGDAQDEGADAADRKEGTGDTSSARSKDTA